MPKTLRARDYVSALDGLLLQGGADMSPKSYGELPINPKRWGGDEVRDQYEIELFHEFVAQGKPVFGICRGHQVINVALGGTLYQDLATQRGEPSAVHRDDTKYDHNFHDMRVLPGTWLSRLYPQVSTKHVNSIHHQAIKDLGDGTRRRSHERARRRDRGRALGGPRASWSACSGTPSSWIRRTRRSSTAARCWRHSSRPASFDDEPASLPR